MGVLRFDAFTLDLRQPMLRRGGAEVPLRPQSLKVLVYLAGRAGEVVSNNELIESLWDDPKQASTNSLAQCINDIREALGDSNRRMVRTVHRRGYVLAAPVSRAAEVAVVDNPVPPQPTHVGARDAVANLYAVLHPWRRALAAGAVVLCLLLSGGWVLWRWLSIGSAAQLTMMAVPSIAVLPFKGEAGADGGLADEIATELARVPRGFRIEIKPAAALVGKALDAKTAGRELGVRYALLGGLRSEGDAVRASIRLIDTESGRQVWTDAFDYAPGETGARRRAAARIARLATEGLLRAESKRPLPPAPKADHYAILGRALITGRDSAAIYREAIALFEKAKSLNEDSVPALQGYARTRITAVLNRWAPPGQRELWLDQAEIAIARIIKSRPRSYGAYRLRGSLLRARHQPENAVKAFDRALELNDSFGWAYAERGRTRIEVGDADKAMDDIKRAIELSPTDPGMPDWCLWAGLAEVHLGRPEKALHWLRRAHDADPAYDRPLLWLAVAEAGRGRWDEAGKLIAKYRAQNPSFTLAQWGEDYPSLHHPVVARQRAPIAAILRRLEVPAGNEAASR